MTAPNWYALAIMPLVMACSGKTERDAPSSLTGLIHSFVVDENYQVVPGVEICAIGRSDIPCVTTGDDGIGDLAVPENEALLISYVKDGFVSYRRQIFSSPDKATGLGTWIFQRKAWYEAETGKLAGDLDYETLGLVGLQSGFFGAVDFALEPDLGKEMKFTLLATSITVCIVKSECELGMIGYGDVPPGEYRATFSASGKTCTPEAFACADGTPGCVELEVVPGEVTFAEVPCE